MRCSNEHGGAGRRSPGNCKGNCPINFSQAEVACHAEESKAWNAYRQLFHFLQVSMDGWVHNDEFEEKAGILHNFVDAFIASAADTEAAKDALRAWRLTASGEESQRGDVIRI